MKEISILGLLDHPFIVSLHILFKDEKFVYFVCGYCPGRDLFTLFDAGGLKEEDVAFYGACVLERSAKSLPLIGKKIKLF